MLVDSLTGLEPYLFLEENKPEGHSVGGQGPETEIPFERDVWYSPFRSGNS